MTTTLTADTATGHINNALTLLLPESGGLLGDMALDAGTRAVLEKIVARLVAAASEIEQDGAPDFVARSITGAMEQERLEIVEELRLARQQVSDGRIHVTVDWAEHRYDVQRELASFDNWPECVAFVRQLRGAATGGPADDQHQPVRAVRGARG